MAETVHLTLLANGVQIEGDSRQTTLGRENTIECLAFEATGTAPQSAGGASGRRRYLPLRIVKPIDRATPGIAKAFTENQVIEGIFRFYRPNPNGDGTTQQHFTVEIRQGRVASIRQLVPNLFDVAVADEPEREEVTFAFSTIVWTFEVGGISHEDTWTAAN
jgi:type VI secretion system secreted protein Hcp